MTMKEVSVKCLDCLRHRKSPFNSDVVDYPPNKYIFRKRDVFFILGAIVTYIIDLMFDIVTAYNHWYHRNTSWFYMTLLFIAVPSIIITIISTWWYLQDSFNPNGILKYNSFSHWVVRCIFLTLQFGPILRYLECLWHGLQSRKAWIRRDTIKQKKLYTLMLYEDADCVLLRLIENFLEAIPQLILQLHILLNYPLYLSSPLWSKLLWMSCLTSLLSVAWGVTAYFRDSRFTDINKNNLSLMASIVILLWQLFSIGSRVLVLVIFSSLVKLWILIVCLSHWCLMFCWFMCRRNFKHLGNWIYELILSSVFGAVYLFAFISDEDARTGFKYCAFYMIFAIENFIMVVVWLLYGNIEVWFYYLGVIVHYICFIIGLAMMVVYYQLLHPTLSRPPESLPNTSKRCTSPASLATDINIHHESQEGTAFNLESTKLTVTMEVSNSL